MSSLRLPCDHVWVCAFFQENVPAGQPGQEIMELRAGRGVAGGHPAPLLQLLPRRGAPKVLQPQPKLPMWAIKHS